VTRGGSRFPLLAALASTGLLVFLALPFVALVLRIAPREFFARLGSGDVLQALALSLLTATVATLVVVVLGTPLAWLLATREFPGKRAVEVLVDLPMVLPPTVAGFALLMAFGRMGLAGAPLAAFGITLPFTTAAVIVAQVFMAAPFYVGAARAGFAGVDRRLLDAAATLRASETHAFLRVVLPLARPALLAGVAMSGARALGEFGATITFAGNVPGRTQTLPLAVYLALETRPEAAFALSLVLLAVSLAVLIGLRGRWLGD